MVAFSIETELHAPRNLRKLLVDQAEPIMMRKCQAIANDAVVEAEAAIRRIFVNDRSGRRRHNRTRHLSGSIRAKAVPDESGDGLPGVIIWSTANAGKVGALEEGSRAHRIYPSEGGYLYFPSNLAQRPLKAGKAGPVRANTGAPRRVAAYQQFRSKGVLLTKNNTGVNHPPYTGKHFMRGGLQRAIRKNS